MFYNIPLSSTELITWTLLFASKLILSTLAVGAVIWMAIEIYDMAKNGRF